MVFLRKVWELAFNVRKLEALKWTLWLTNLCLRLHECTGKYNKIDSWIQKNGCFPSPKKKHQKNQPREPNHQPTHQSPNTEVFFLGKGAFEALIFEVFLVSLVSSSFLRSLFRCLRRFSFCRRFWALEQRFLEERWVIKNWGTRSMEKWMQQLSCLSHLQLRSLVELTRRVGRCSNYGGHHDVK